MPQVMFATDFSPGSESAFVHALALALVHAADLAIVHVEPGDDPVDWNRYPGVRPRLTDWGLLPPGAGKADVARELGVHVRKLAYGGRDPVKALERALNDRQPDLLVLGTSGATGLLGRSVSRAVARVAYVPTLVVPDGAPGFVRPADGALSLRRALVGVDAEPDPRFAIATAARLLRGLASEGTEVDLLHVGPAEAMPHIPDAHLPAAKLTRTTRTGDAATEIARRADEIDADVIVLATEGRQGLIDALRGRVTERVMARARRPVLSVPVAAV